MTNPISHYTASYVSPYHGRLNQEDQVSDIGSLEAIAAWLVAQGNNWLTPAKLRRIIAQVLRDAGVLAKGARVAEYRVEPDADCRYRIVVFPRLPGFSTYHHSITLTPSLVSQ